ncbi:MAG: glycosyltransferase family 87 protein [Acidobacteria bacterium]|nr:glycosyltransferase family 87 protein [Acidobacteriota bacterium]
MRTLLIPLGVALAATMAVAARLDVRRDTGIVLVLAAVASAIYLFAMWLISRGRVPGRAGLWVCLALAVLCRAPLVPADPTLSDDIYRYIWDGRAQAFGVNPYQAVPADPALDFLHTDTTRKMNHPGQPTMYPPFAEWVFRGIAAIDQSVIAFKLTFVLLDLIIIFLVMRWLVASGRSAWLVLVYAWNPLVILEIAGSGHLDVVGAALLMVSFLALSNRMGWLAAIAFVAAIELKFVPIVLAPLFWRRIRVRDAVIAAGFGLLLALPFTGGTLTAPIGALPAYLAKWRFNGPVYAMAQSAIGMRALVALPLVAGLVAAAWFRWRSRELAPSAWAWPMGVALLLSPTVYPWYLLWLCPFLVERATVPLLIWTQTSLLTYFVWRVSASGGGWQLPWWVLTTEFGVVAAAGVWLVARRTPTKALS